MFRRNSIKAVFFAVSLLCFLPHFTKLQTITPKQARQACKLLTFKALRAGRNRPKIAPKSPTIAPRGAQVIDFQGVAGVILSPRFDWATARRLGVPCFALFRGVSGSLGLSVCRSVSYGDFRGCFGAFWRRFGVMYRADAPTLRVYRRCIGTATAPRLDGSTARRLDGSTARRLDGSTARRLDVAPVSLSFCDKFRRNSLSVKALRCPDGSALRRDKQGGRVVGADPPLIGTT